MIGARSPLVCAMLLAASASACGGSGTGGFSPAIERNFIEACTASGAQFKSCRCVYARLKDTVSYEDFKAADDAIRSGGKASPGMRAKVAAAREACA
jgi:hypothetical protein